MSADKKTTPPQSGNGGSPAVCTTTPCPKCWTDDYAKEISTSTYGRYFRKYKPNGSTEVPLNISARFKIYAPVKSATRITVEVRFKIEKDGDVSDVDLASAKTKLANGVDTYWNNKFNLVAKDPECPPKTFKIVFKPIWVDSGQHYTMKIHHTYPREGVTGTDMDVSKSTTAWTYAHEFGHCFGLPDEYSYAAGETQIVKYIKPDGTLDAAISAPFDGKSKTDHDATIMAAFDSATTLPRHAWNIAIEVRDLLTQKLGRNIKCDIQ